MGLILKNHNTVSEPLRSSFMADDKKTMSGVSHRKLVESDSTKLCEYMMPKIKKHHINEENYLRRKALLEALAKSGLVTDACKSPYPRADKTRKGNYAEVLLAEYLQETTDTKMPLYRLQFNTNPDQAMKGDDVLLFDLDSTPVRIIIGEAKFRKAAVGYAVQEAIEGLTRAKNNIVPISLLFVADTLRATGNNDYADRVEECALLITQGKAETDYVGLLMSDNKASTVVDANTTNSLHNLLMISVSMQSPETVVKEAFDKLEEEYERI